jgi:EAL domain-containing protein (putative c-di-GMP-specific phosphodiesterase class I)
MLGDMAHGEDATHIADKVLEQFSRAFRLGVRDHFVTLSIGISLYPGDGDAPEPLLKNADIAMYRAKQEGRNRYQFYSAEMAAAATERLALLTELRFAIERSEFFVLYQPQVELRSGRLSGLEALLRWEHPERGVIEPGQFVPIAEESGLIPAIGEWVLREVCRQTHDWILRGYNPPPVSVNFSAYQFRSRQLVDIVLRVLAETGLDPRQLVVEITETALLQDDESSLEILRALSARGIKVSLDDFGTGYSSLSYLKRFPIDILKIDSSFVRDIDKNPDDAAIAFAIVSLAHSLGRRVVAEGVETGEQLALLRDYGCDCIQGYLCSRPLPTGELEALLREGDKRVLDASGASQGQDAVGYGAGSDVTGSSW